MQKTSPLPSLPASLAVMPVASVLDATTSGITLLAGPPGSRKSGFALQTALDRALVGRSTLIVLSEESPDRVRERAKAMLGSCGNKPQILGRLLYELAPKDPYALLTRVERRLWELKRDVDLVVVDSIQGVALSPRAEAEFYRAAITSAQLLQGRGISTLLIGHVTKQNAIRGPRTLEHAVDSVVLLDRRGGRRTICVPKNRFGPAILRPIPVRIESVSTRLVPMDAVAGGIATVYSVLPTIGVVEIQVAASLALKSGRIESCRGMGVEEVRHVVGVLGRTCGFAGMLSDLNLAVMCRWPLSERPRNTSTTSSTLLHLPLCLGIVGACLGHGDVVPDYSIGEIDLAGRLRPLSPKMIEDLEDWLPTEAGAKLLCPSSSLRRQSLQAICECLEVPTIGAAIERYWSKQELEDVLLGS